MKLANWEKQNYTKYKLTEDHISEMSLAMDSLCTLLAVDSSDFNKVEFLGIFGKYIEANNRLLYTNISNTIFNNYDIIGTYQTNLESVIAYSYEDILYDKQKVLEHEKIQRALMKFWDHINLAIRQYELFNQNDEHYEIIATKKLKDVEIRLTKEMNMQLISLIAIFTALSFILFGGISSLDNIFLGAKDIPVTKLMIVGVIWCFCIMNLIYVFMFLVAKLTGLTIKSTQDADANLVQKYPLIWWCNWVLIATLIFSCWAYYIKCEGFSSVAYEALKQHPTIFFVIGTLILLIIVGLGAKKIYQLSKTNKKNGWQKEKGNWRYYYYGVIAKNEWKKSGANWYYFGKNGHLIKEDFIIEDDGNNIYYVDKTGRMVTNQFIDKGEKKRYLDKSGKAVLEGERTIDGKRYKFQNGFVVNDENEK